MDRTTSSSGTGHAFPRLLLLAGILGLLPGMSSAGDYLFQWGHPLPQGNRLGGAAFESNLVGYAVGDGGSVLRTTDGGASWQLMTDINHFEADLKDVMVLAPGELLAVGSAPGIFRSLNGGAIWSPVPNPSAGTLNDLEFVAPGVLAAVGDAGQALRSSDNGDSWTLLGSTGGDGTEQYWLDLATGYVVGPTLACRTTNGGASWAAVPGVSLEPRVNEVFFDGPLRGFIYSDFSIWSSADGGASWQTDSLPNPTPYAADALVISPETFLVVSNFEGATVVRSTDGGTSWETLFFCGEDGFLDVDRLPDGTLVAVGSEGDIYRSTDGGLAWANTIEAGVPPRQPIGALDVGPGGEGAAGSSGTPGPQWYRTTDGGDTWSPDPAGPAIPFTSDLRYWDADHAIAGGDFGSIWRTTDGGDTWTAVALPAVPANGAAQHLSLPAQGVAFAAVTGQTQGFVYRTTDFGASWHQRSTGIPSSGGLTGVSFVSPNAGFVAGHTSIGAGRFFRTTDGGASWAPVATSGLPAGWLWDIHFHDASTGLATLGGSGTGIYRTADGGASWSPVFAGDAKELDFRDASFGLAARSSFFTDGSVVESEDGGLTWQTVELPARNARTAVAVTDDGFIVGGAHGVILRATRVPTSVDGGAGAPDPVVRLRAAPSVGSRIGIQFEPARDGRADLDIVDVTGRRVTTLRSGVFTPGTTVAASWDGTTARGERASSGVYFVRLREADQATAIRVVLIR